MESNLLFCFNSRPGCQGLCPVLGMSRDEDSAATLGNLLQCLTTRKWKSFFFLPTAWIPSALTCGCCLLCFFCALLRSTHLLCNSTFGCGRLQLDIPQAFSSPDYKTPVPSAFTHGHCAPAPYLSGPHSSRLSPICESVSFTTWRCKR